MLGKIGIANRASLRYLAQHPWITALSVLGIALGVAVVVSIDLANVSAQRAFQLSAERVAGRTTHQVIAPETVDGDVYRIIRVEAGLRRSAPIVEGFAVHMGRTYQVLGIDPFADAAFRSYVSDLSTLDLGAFLGDRSVVLAPPSMQAASGDTLHLSIGGSTEVVAVGGMHVPDDEASQAALDHLIVTDVGTAQRLFGMGDRLSRIDLILEDGEEEALSAFLPEGTRLVRSNTRTQALDQMTAAFELNLRALSLLALVVAMFLIYNTITFSVVQRRQLIGRLRAIGVTRRQLFRQILVEALIMGSVGAAAGVLLGVLLAHGLVRMVTRTINDLYYVLEVRSLAVPPIVLLKAVGLGLVATVAAAIAPAREGASVPIAVVLRRSEVEQTLKSRVPALVAAGCATAIAAAVLLIASGRNLTLSYTGLALVLAAFALWAPALTMWFARALRHVLTVPYGLIGRMSAQGIVHNLSRTSVAIAALTIAVAATVGVGIMVGSFRDTVTDWLDYTLQADLYLQAPDSGVRLGRGLLPLELVGELADIPGVRDVSSVRRLEIMLGAGRTGLAAIEPGPAGRQMYRYREGDPDQVWAAFTQPNAVLVSEPLAFRMDVGPGDSLQLHTDRGNRSFQVAGVFYDYASDQGLVVMRREEFVRWYDAAGLSGISLFADSGEDAGADPNVLAERVRAAIATDVVIRSNGALREAALDVFDRTFAITSILRILALAVAFAGVLSALMALQIERKREFAILRAEGMTPRLLRRYVLLQTGAMGLIAGVLAVPLGVLLAYVLIFVINKRSFGWTLDMTLSPEVLLQALLLALVAAVVAGIYPAHALVGTNTAAALRSE